MNPVLNISIVPGDTAPRYDTGVEASLSHVTITEQGTQARLPIVDLVAKLPDGTQVLIVISGRHVCALAAAVRGINLRNHGVEEP